MTRKPRLIFEVTITLEAPAMVNELTCEKQNHRVKTREFIIT